MTTVTSSQILHHTTCFLSEVISQQELRHHLFAILCHRTHKNDQTKTLKPLKLAFETLEKTICATTNSTNSFSLSSSLRLAEKLLLSYPETLLSTFLLSLTYTLNNKPKEASLKALNLFFLDPSFTRTELAPLLFEELFLVHILPVLEWFNQQRSKILSSLSIFNNMVYEQSGETNSFCDVSVVVPSSKSLSKMSGNQAVKLTALESSYEEVVDENCRVFAKYFKEVLENNGHVLIRPPMVVLGKRVKGEEEEEDRIGENEDDRVSMEEIGINNGRYNPIWADRETSVEFQSLSCSIKSTSSPSYSYPLRVSAEAFKIHDSKDLTVSPAVNSDSEMDSSSLDNDLVGSSFSESEAETEENNRKIALFKPRKSQKQKQKESVVEDSSCCSLDPFMADSDNAPGCGKHTPPKDFVCPITSHLFDDPVTLETGQTYERRAIQEWIDRGNSTCPITRQELQSTQLPKTNYVLKRLIASWQEHNPGMISYSSETQNCDAELKLKKELLPSSTSPNSVISQASIDGTMSELRHVITNLCTSEILQESEMAVLRIEQFWNEANMELDVQNMLSKPPVINGFVEILFNSLDPQVLKATVFLLSELGSRDKGVIQTLTRVDSDVECIVALFKKGLSEAVVLLYMLKPSTMNLLEMDMVEALLLVIKKKEDTMLKMCLKPRTASVLLLGQILGSSEKSVISAISNAIVSTKVFENIVISLEAEWMEERIAAVGILLKCIQEDGKCRNLIAEKAGLAPVLESFTTASDSGRFEIVQFLAELVKLNRRTLNEQILLVIKDEGAFSTMHTLLNYLQTAEKDQCPVAAGLLLQLDLLTEPRKMSIYREEAIDSLISCLRNSEFPFTQLAAAETIAALQGRFTASGKSLTRALLLKRAGHNKTYRNLMQMEKLGNFAGEIDENSEKEKEAEAWERKMAFSLVSHEFGLIFEALAEGLKNKHAELNSTCLVAATWLIHMLNSLPDTGIKGAARVCLLKNFISIFKSSKNIEDKILSLFSLNSFISDPEGLRDLTSHMKDIKKELRELKKSSTLAFEILKVLSEGHESSADLWKHTELVQVDCNENGEVLSLISYKDKIFSGHSDGTVKVWTGRGSILHLVQEVREHTKAVTSLAALKSGERLYSGSLDRTTRVWSIGNEGINCIQVYDMKDQIHNLVVANTISCFIPQGAGVKVHSWTGASKLLNPYKYVKCLSLLQGKLYCGCHDSSIQEIDLATGTLVTIQHGTRKLLGKSSPIHALQVCDGFIYAASSALDGSAVKIWNESNYGLVGSLQTTSEVRVMAASSDLIYLGCKGGNVEVWERKKQTRIEVLQASTNCRIVSMALDDNEEIILAGTSDGRIQAWGLR